MNEKLIRRHPHVFGENRLETSAQVLEQWDADQSAGKKGGAGGSIFKKSPPRLPALMFAEAVWKQIEKKKLPASGAPWMRRRSRSARRAADGAALGRMLFELTAAAQVKGLDPEDALRRHASHVMREVETQFRATADLSARNSLPDFLATKRHKIA